MEEVKQKQIFKEWLDQHKGLLFKIIRAYAFNAEDRDDLFQEISIQIWKSIPSFKEESSVSTWLYKIGLYSAMSWSKKEKKHKERQQPIPTDTGNILISETEINVNPQLSWLYKEIRKLDKVDRSLMLLLLDGYSYKEMSHMLGIGESNVGVKINRIKKKLLSKSKRYSNDRI